MAGLGELFLLMVLMVEMLVMKVLWTIVLQILRLITIMEVLITAAVAPVAAQQLVVLPTGATAIATRLNQPVRIKSSSHSASNCGTFPAEAARNSTAARS
jgi:hypothetical protein